MYGKKGNIFSIFISIFLVLTDHLLFLTQHLHAMNPFQVGICTITEQSPIPILI